MINKEQQIKEWFEYRIKHFKDNSILYMLNLFKLSNKDFYRDLIFLIKDFGNIETVKEYSVGVLIYALYLLSEYYNKDFDKSLLCLKNILIKKNKDYQNNFDKSINKFGWIYLSIELNKKKNRLHSLLKNKEKNNNRVIKNTLFDIAGYCILSLIYIENNGA